MAYKRLAPKIVAASASLLLMRAAAAAAPQYNIIPFAPIGTDTFGFGQGISPNGTYAAGLTGNASYATEGVLYNTVTSTATVNTQTGIVYNGTTTEYTGVPYSVNNNGIMFGSSGAGNVAETGAPTVWQGGAAYNLPLPRFTNAGQVYGSNDLNQAVGSVGGNGGLNQAALFFYYGPNSASNYTAELKETTNNGDGDTLGAAFGINDSDVIVGTAIDPVHAALTVPFMLNLGAGATTATIIPNSSSKFNSGIPFAISNSGLVAGSELYNSGGGEPFIYNSSTGITTSIPLVAGASQGGARGVNDQGEVVGTDSGAYALPFLYDGTNSYLLSSLLVNNASGAWHLSDNTSSGAFDIADNGDIVGRGMYNGVLTAFVMVPVTAGTGGTTVTLSFGGTGDGTTWDTTQLNFNNGSGAVAFSNSAGENVVFNDSTPGYNISIPALVTPASTTVNNSAGNYVFSGAGGIGGSGGLNKLGTALLTLNTVNTYTGPTNVSGGSLILGVAGALPGGTNLSIGTGASVVANSVGTAYALQVGTLNLSGGTLDLKNNDLVVHSGTLAAVNTLVQTGYNGGNWNGTGGIVSSSAGPAHPLMALGTIINDNGQGTPLYGSGGTIATAFGGTSPVDGDILVKFTYYGDANLDGKVDGTDYAQIDNGYASQLTGWFNGDFNYDGVVDGSDYALIDNSFNTQGAQVASAIAASTTEIASLPAASAVPEPTSAVMLGIGLTGLLTRRRRFHRNSRNGV